MPVQRIIADLMDDQVKQAALLGALGKSVKMSIRIERILA
jgi:hypothetical protein